MLFGISTACMYLKENTEDALKYLSNSGVDICEVFLATHSEYTQEFASILKENKGKITVNSVHALNTQFEPQLYSDHERQKADAYNTLNNVLGVAKELDAKFLTFHGLSRLKKINYQLDYEKIGKKTKEINETCNKYGVTLSYENVHWAYYNFSGFFKELKKFVPELKATLDVKQARQSGFDVEEYIKDMSGNISTVHLSDMDENGKICLPSKLKGKTDLKRLSSVLKDNGFDGAVIIEVYADNYRNYQEIIESTEYVKGIFNK